MFQKVAAFLLIHLFISTSFATEKIYNSYTWKPITGENVPHWFPTLSCREVYYKSQSKEVANHWYHQFNYEKFRSSNYSDKELKNHKPYKDFVSTVEENLKYNGKTIKRSECYKDWTILVAMDADNDLHPYALWDIFEMESPYKAYVNGSTLKKDVLVQLDEEGDTGINRYHIFQNPPSKRYLDKWEPGKPMYMKVREKSDFEGENAIRPQSPIVESYPENYLKSKVKRFESFIEWGIRSYPARHYMIILWGHGKGWIKNESERGVHLRGHELASSLKWIQQEVLEGKKRIDNFVADACYMQGLEVAQEIAPYTRFISGSAQVQTFLGLPYRTFFNNMNYGYPYLKNQLEVETQKTGKTPNWWNDGPAKAARVIPEVLNKTVQISKEDPKRSGYQGRVNLESQNFDQAINFFTFSSINSESLLNQLMPSLQNFATQFNNYLNKINTDLREELSLNVRDSLWNGAYFATDIETFEMGSFLYEIREILLQQSEKIPYSLMSSLEESLMAVEKTMINPKFSKNEYRNPGFKVLGFWFPQDKDGYKENIGYFKKVDLYYSPTTDRPTAPNTHNTITTEKAIPDQTTPWHELVKTLLGFKQSEI